MCRKRNSYSLRHSLTQQVMDKRARRLLPCRCKMHVVQVQDCRRRTGNCPSGQSRAPAAPLIARKASEIVPDLMSDFAQVTQATTVKRLQPE